MAICTAFQILPGLPGEGTLPLQFSASGQGMHREGYVVSFRPSPADSWVGNFQPGLSSYYEVIPHETHLVVVAGGQAYVVDPHAKQVVACFGGQIQLAQPLAEGLLVSNGLWFDLLAGTNLKWRSKRVSWDGLRNTSIHAELVSGEGWRYDNSWHSFSIRISDGATSGGAYDGPEP